ncbi:small proline-rich protein 4 [Herpailurus yagouaroundi]|nr:small proline-rich protein 4 [Puma yagouaroundi]
MSAVGFLSGCPVPVAMSSWQQQTIQHLPQKAQQQVKQPCQPPSVRCQEMCAPQIKDPCAPQPKKQYSPKGTFVPTQHKCSSAQQAPKSKQK